jgi:vitamin B12 transporter
VGGAFFYGADTRAGNELPFAKGPFKSLGFSLSYQYMMSYLLAYGYTFESNKRIPYMPVHHAGAGAELAWKTGSLSVTGQYEGERYNDTGNFALLKPFFNLTANVNQKIGKNFSAFAVARNILNQSYQSFKDYPMPGITLTLGMRAQFEVK